MSFALDSGDALIVWEDDGKVSGFPSDAVSDAEDALMAPGVQRATPTGPFFAEGTPEASFLVLRGMWPQAEVSGDPPVFEEQPDELDVPEPVQEASYDEALHPRGRGGEWVRKLMSMPGMKARRAAHDVHDAFRRKELPEGTGKEAISALGRVLAARAEAAPKFEADVLRLLRDARPRYGEGKVQVAPGSDEAMAALVQRAARWFPAEWIDNAGPVQLRASGFGNGADAYMRPEIAKSKLPTLFVAPGENREKALVHEMAHWLEDRNPEVSRETHAFLARRTEGAPEQALNDLDSSAHMQARVKDGGFVDAYMGRVYEHNSTEVLSMAMEALVGGAIRIEDDPDHLEWVMSLLSGGEPERVMESVFDPAKHPRGRTGEWVHILGRLHEITRADVEAGRVPGVRHDPNISPGIAAHMRDREMMTLGPAAYLPNGKIDTMLVAHEAGHRVGQHLMAKEGRGDFPEVQAFRGEGTRLTPGVGHMPVFDNPFGASTRPEEMLADAYSELLHHGLRGSWEALPGDRVHVPGHDHPGEIDRIHPDREHADVRFPDGRVAEKIATAGMEPADEPTDEYPRAKLALLKKVQQAARELGMPDRRLYRWRPDGSERISEAFDEGLHPRDRLGKWRREPGLIHAFKHVAEGVKGSYEVERTGKVWEARKNGQRLGLTRALARAKDMVAEHDSGDYGRDRRALLEDAYRGGGHIHEVWGGDPAVMPEDEYQAARARLTELHDSIGSGTLLDRDLRAMIEATLWRASGDRAARQG